LIRNMKVMRRSVDGDSRWSDTREAFPSPSPSRKV
jgi:hypothetical protein